jgi:type II secretory pathway pseudopilin PulG
MLVVLALISFMTALIAPRLATTVEAISRSGERSEVKRQLEKLPLSARAQGRSFRFTTGQSLSGSLIQLPPGWMVVPITSFSVAANGICEAAELQVTPPGAGEERWHMAQPDCRIGDGG